MTITYFKRFRMQYDLSKELPGLPDVPAGYSIHAWDPTLLVPHSRAKYASFRYELDANVFPCLGDSEGCYRLMREISSRNGFVPEATWLLSYRKESSRFSSYCGTVQGIKDHDGFGSIQNLGIAPECRGLGLGTLLLGHALRGFQSLGLRFATLEVTAQNLGAYRLYHRFGFRTVRTVFKSTEVVYA